MIYPQLSDCEIGFIGAGNISDAIANGFTNSGLYLIYFSNFFFSFSKF